MERKDWERYTTALGKLAISLQVPMTPAIEQVYWEDLSPLLTIEQFEAACARARKDTTDSYGRLPTAAKLRELAPAKKLDRHQEALESERRHEQLTGIGHPARGLPAADEDFDVGALVDGVVGRWV
jgi:hypothetical protein